MTVLKYWDAGSSAWKILAGPPGPTVVSNDANNLARLGSDNTLYVPSTSVGRNVLHNSMFRIQQRGTGSWTSGYGPDRWACSAVTDTSTYSIQTAPDAVRTAVGDEECISLFNVNVTGNAAAGAYSQFFQRVESVRRLANKTVTLSFWAQVGTAGLKIGLSYIQLMGTGGSPSANVTSANIITITAADNNWHRYTVTFTLPSLSGKTLGTNGDDCTQISFWLSSGATNNPAAGTGVQTGTFVFWGMQLEIGSVMTPLEKIDIALDRAESMRFYQPYSVAFTSYGAASQGIVVLYPFPVPFRAQPTITPSFSTQTNCSASTISAISPNQYQHTCTVTALGAFTSNGSFTASADL